MPKISNSYQAGYRAKKYKPTTENYNFQFFATPEDTREWEIGEQDGENAKFNPDRLKEEDEQR